jgi:hypothetical protein
MTLLHLHLGAHKTGSTYLQKSFLASLQSFDSIGISYIPLAESRSLVLPAVRGKSPFMGANSTVIRGCRDLLADRFREHGAVLLSDENLLGSLYRFSGGRGLYPSSQANIRSLVDIMGRDVEVIVYLSVRSYASWLQSAYVQLLKRRRLVAFADFIKNVRFSSLSWPGLVERISRALPGAKIVIWPYELFAKDNALVLAYLAQKLGGVDLQMVAARPNPSLSAIAHEILMTCKQAGIEESDIPSLLKYLQAHLSVARGYAKPVLLDPDEISFLEGSYASHLRQLQLLPYVEMLGED